MRIKCLERFRNWSLPSKIGVVSGILGIISFIFFLPFFRDDYSIYKYVMSIFEKNDPCLVTVVDKNNIEKNDYDPNRAVFYINTLGHKKMPNNTKLTIKKGDICGTLNIDIQLPGQSKPYNLGDLSVSDYKIILPIPMVFISYTDEDKVAVEQIADRLLQEDSILTWIEKKDILPGDNFEKKIQEAIDKADRVLFFISKASLDQNNNAQNALEYALRKKELKPFDDRFIIPILLEESNLPNEFKDLSWLNMWESNAYEKLVQAIKFE